MSTNRNTSHCVLEKNASTINWFAVTEPYMATKGICFS